MRQPYYLKKRKCWYAWIDGKQQRLDPDKQTAFDKFHKRMASEEINGEVPVARLLDAALDWMALHRSAKTYAWYKDHLNSFAKSIGADLSITELKPYHVTDWLDAKEWSNNTKHRAIAAVQRVFNWARKQGYIVRSPLEGMEKPEVTPRDVIVTDAHYKALLEKTPDQAGRDFWVFLWETGCRVNEARIGYLAQLTPVRLAWTDQMFDGTFKGKQPEGLSIQEWQQIATFLQTGTRPSQVRILFRLSTFWTAT